MNRTWKWILGIVIVLVVTALIVTPFVLGRNMVAGMNYGMRALPQDRNWNDGPMMGRGNNNWSRHPMMGGYGFYPFGGLFMGIGMLLGLIIPLGLLFAVVYGAARLAVKNGLPQAAPAAAAPPATHPCVKCGYPLQEGWKHCPECGERQ